MAYPTPLIPLWRTGLPARHVAAAIPSTTCGVGPTEAKHAQAIVIANADFPMASSSEEKKGHKYNKNVAHVLLQVIRQIFLSCAWIVMTVRLVITDYLVECGRMLGGGSCPCLEASIQALNAAA